MTCPVRGTVVSVTDLSPSFRRIVFSGPDLNRLAAGRSFYDQRIKLIFPGEAGALPQLSGSPEWYKEWLALSDGERGIMRTYSIRELTRENEITRLTVDFVLHFSSGESGPAARWAARAEVGSELLISAPLHGLDAGGIEFSPGCAGRVVLLGDETAAPAIARILEDLRAESSSVAGHAYLEVPREADRLEVNAPEAFGISWLPRNGAAHGERLADALGWDVAAEDMEDPMEDELVWETPVFSASGEELAPIEPPAAGTYYWIAGESGVIKRLRRFLVREVGVDRKQVAFMGYWRDGVAMRG